MSRCPPGVYDWAGGVVSQPIPWIGDPGPGDEPATVPDQPGAAGERWLVATQLFPFGGVPVVLWGAKVTALAIKDLRLGANAVTVTVPATPVNMRILGQQMSEFDPQGRHLHSMGDAVRWEILVGSTLDGDLRWRFVVRDEVVPSGDVVTINAVGFVGGVTADRVIGAPTRLNMLDTAGDDDLGPIGSFDFGTLQGWSLVANGERFPSDEADAEIDGLHAVVVPGGVEGTHKVKLTGKPDRMHYLERRVRYTQIPRPWGQERVAGQAWVQLPAAGIDIEGYGLVTVGVEEPDGSVVYWPPNGPLGSDPEAGKVTADMVRGSFGRDPVVGVGKLPSPPYAVDICVRLHPTDETAATYYDGVKLLRHENTSTVTPKDLTRHVRKLFDTAQGGRLKSPWGIRIEYGTDTGIVEVGTWWHQDGQSLTDALRALCERGMDIWDQAGPGRVVVASKRRGAVRRDMPIHQWDLLGSVTWRIDPGSQRTAVRATSSASTVFSGADQGAIDLDAAFGQVIDVIMSAPVGMTPNQLARWTREQLGTLKLVQTTGTLLLPWRVGMRLSVGYSILVLARTGSAALKGWQRITQWQPDFARRFVAVDCGTDPDLGS